jgi:ribonuclease VapC
MIVFDTSAIVAMILGESGHQSLVARMQTDGERAVSPVSIVEATMVLSRTYSKPNEVLQEFIEKARLKLSAVDSHHAELAQHAFLEYGKGRHPARLNFGDCFSYAAAKALNAPLLYTGGDFVKTDVRSA